MRQSHSYNRQSGLGLILFFMALLLTGTTFIVYNLPNNTNQIKAQSKTNQALIEAKQALLSYAVSHYYRTNNAGAIQNGFFAYLPCPEATAVAAGEGNQANNCDAQQFNALGRLPWKSLNISPLKDSSGQCLWYAVSAAYKQNPKLMHNIDSVGMFDIYDESGNKLNGNLPENRIAAVIIAPGSSLSTQSRPSAVKGQECIYPQDLVQAADFLDNTAGIDNASLSNTPDKIDSFAGLTTGNSRPNFNDRLITITQAEIFNAINALPGAVITTELNTLGNSLTLCLVNYSLLANEQLSTSFLNDNIASLTPLEIANLNADYLICNTTHNNCINPGTDAFTCESERLTCRQAARDTHISSIVINDFFHLPWPAPVDLSNAATDDDYRNSNNYSDQVNLRSGRFPLDISNSNAAIGLFPVANNIFQNCAMSNPNNTQRRLWENWKDQIFLVIAPEFEPGAGPTPAAAACLQCPLNDGVTARASILIANNINLGLNQLRRDNDLEPTAYPLNTLKGSVANYLEGNNLTSFNTFPAGARTFINGAPSNDILISVPIP